LGKIGAKATLKKGQDLFLITYSFALFFNRSLISPQLLNSITDLITYLRESFPYILIALKHQNILSDDLKKVLPKLFDLVSVNYIPLQQLLRLPDEHHVSILHSMLTNR